LGVVCLGGTYAVFVVCIDPQYSSGRVGDIFSLNITASDVSPPGLWAYELKLHYNNSLLTPVSAKIPIDHFLRPTLSPDNLFIIDAGTVNQTEGTVSFAATLGGEEPGKTGSGTLANLTFRPITTGNSTLTIGGRILPEPKFVDGDGNIIPSYGYSLTDGYTEGLPPLPPSIQPPPATAGKQTLGFRFTGTYGYLIFPEECHPGDTITHELLVAAEPIGTHLNYFRLNISCTTPLEEKTLYNEMIENEDLPGTWILNTTATLTIPNDASGKVRCIIETESAQQSATSDNTLDTCTTYIRTLTYTELQTAYENLLNLQNNTKRELEQWMAQYQDLNATYNQLLNLHNTTITELQHWQNEYQELNNTYNQFLTQHNSTAEGSDQWMNMYEELNNTYSQLLGNYCSLNMTYYELQLDYNTLKSSYDSLEANILLLNSSYNSLKDSFESLQTNDKDLAEKYNSLNLTYQELNLNFTNLQFNFEELKNNLTSLQAAYDNLSSSYNSLNTTYSLLLHEYEDLRSSDDPLIRELWLTRVLWFIFLVLTIAAMLYAVYLIRKQN
jgi:predicted nuclease with TOPRIM domain